MGSEGIEAPSRPPLNNVLSAVSLPSSLLSRKRRAPVPALSFNSLNPFQSPRSNVSSPGSLYLSPPISSPTLMSPPPRQEGEDYLSLHNSHSGKSRHHSRTPGTSKLSSLVTDSRLAQISAAEGPKNLSTGTRHAGDSDRPPTVPSVESSESPAVVSLRRLSQAPGDNAVIAASTIDDAPKSLLKTVESLFTTKDAVPSSWKNSEGDTSAPKVGLRRRSTAFRDGNRRRPSKAETKATLPGLGVPATITLRKATGLFPAKAAVQAIGAEEDSDAKDRRSSLSTTCTLIGFGSRQLDLSEHIIGEENEFKQRRPSIYSTKGHDLLAYISTVIGTMDSRRQSLAETAVTVANIFPSAAILASPAKSSPSTTESERRFSVIQIKSRKSVHQVIWREDDTSSSSATSDDPISPTDSYSSKDQETAEDGPLRNSEATAKNGTRRSSSLATPEGPSLPLNMLAHGDITTPFQPVLPARDDQMFGWSWGAFTNSPGDYSNNKDFPKAFASSAEKKGGMLAGATSGTASAVPQLLVPDDEDLPLNLTNQALHFSRRASFAVDPSGFMTVGAGRELGSRRSISVHPSLLVSMGEEEDSDQDNGAAVPSRRFSRRDVVDLEPWETPRPAMAPDLNTVPPSPHTGRQNPASIPNRNFEPMAPPPNPTSSSASNVSSREPPSIGPGPLRHPQPLTAADLHMELEKEQEAVVNRLTRELSLLRQQTASVASTTSSNSAGPVDPTDYNMNHLISGPTHPTPSRRHRSSSSLSTRSINTAATTTSGYTGLSGSTVGTTGGVAGSTISGVAPARDPYGYGPHPSHAQSLSRQNSTTSSRRSQASSPSLSSSLLQGDHFPNLVSHRHASSSQPPTSSGQSHQHNLTPAASARSSYLHSSAATARYEETAHHRSEMEIVKRENEMLRRRIRELERTLGSRRASSVSHTRSDSAGTGIGAPPSATGVQRQGDSSDFEDDAVHVGESAGSVGLGGGH
ncbi:MAG: hypothetical protein Q9218_002627 [Villophora microphyllina]